MSDRHKFPRADVEGVTGDRHDPERMVVRLRAEGGGAPMRLSIGISDLRALGEMVDRLEPQLRKLWTEKGAQE